MSENTPQNNTLFALLFGGLFIVVGALVILVGAGIIPSPSGSMHATRLVIATLGAAFLFGGLMVTTIALFPPAARQTALFQWLQYVFTLGFLITFTGVVVWVGLGPGNRRFSGGIGPLFFSNSMISNLIGRLLFGGFGLLLVAVTLWFAIVQPLQLLGLWPRRRSHHDDTAG